MSLLIVTMILVNRLPEIDFWAAESLVSQWKNLGNWSWNNMFLLCVTHVNETVLECCLIGCIWENFVIRSIFHDLNTTNRLVKLIQRPCTSLVDTKWFLIVEFINNPSLARVLRKSFKVGTNVFIHFKLLDFLHKTYLNQTLAEDISEENAS